MLVLFYHKSGDLGSSTGFMGWRNTFDTLIKNRKLNIPRASFAGTIQHDTVIVLEK